MTTQLTVVYDACVLYPNYLRDFLIQLATAGLFRARWTMQIHEEWGRNLLQNRSDVTVAQVRRIQALMNRAVPDCLVSDFEVLIPALVLPDSDDRHVLAAAIATQANVIVTLNLKDFPASALEPYGVEAQHPDDFVADLIDLQPWGVFGAVQKVQARLRNPPVGLEVYLESLSRQGLTISVSMLRELTGKG